MERKAAVTAVHDGDTFTALVDLAYGVKVSSPFRVEGIQAPEMSSLGGRDARDYLRSLILGRDVTLITEDRREKYGRILADVRIGQGLMSGLVSKLMIEAKHAVEWDGKGPKPMGESRAEVEWALVVFEDFEVFSHEDRVRAAFVLANEYIKEHGE